MTAPVRRLRTLLSLAIITTSLAALGVFILGMLAFYVTIKELWLAGLSPDNQATLAALLNDGAVSPEALTTLVNVFSLYWVDGRYAQVEMVALAVLAVVTILVSVATGVTVSRKLSAPIETVTEAAGHVAAGHLAHRMPDVEGGASETHELLAAFRAMTKSLEEAEREASESAAAIAHELRTPLTILRGRLQGLGDGVFESSKTMTDGMIAQVDTLSRIVDELSLLSRLSAGRFAPQAIRFDLAHEARRVATAMGPDLVARDMALEVSLDGVWLDGDPVLIRQALTALLDNALSYAAAGRFLRIETSQGLGSGLLRVIDHGPGIDPADQDRVFDRWWRGDRSRNRSQGGTGLGLCIVKAIATAHGGTIAVRCSDEGGTTMELSLPLPSDEGSCGTS